LGSSAAQPDDASEILEALCLISLQTGLGIDELWRMPITRLAAYQRAGELHGLMEQFRMVEVLGCLTEEGSKQLQAKAKRMLSGATPTRQPRRRSAPERIPLKFENGIPVVEKPPPGKFGSGRLYRGKRSGYKPFPEAPVKPLSAEEESLLRSMGLLHTKEE